MTSRRLLLLGLLPALVAAGAGARAAEPGGGAAPGLVVRVERLIVQDMGVEGQEIIDVVEVRNEGAAALPEVALPLARPRAGGVDFLEGIAAADAEVREEAVIDRRGLGPGEGRAYTFTYRVAVRLPADVRRPILHPTDRLVVVVPEGQLRVSAPTLADAGTEAMGRRVVRRYENPAGRRLEPDPAFSLRLSRNVEGVSASFWALLGLIALPAVALLAIAVRSRRLRR